MSSRNLSCHASKFAHTPNGVGGQKSDHAGHRKTTLLGLEQVSADPSHEDKQEGERDQLKTESLVVGCHESENQAKYCNQQWRAVAEIAGARPNGVDDQRDRKSEQQRGTVLAEL